MSYLIFVFTFEWCWVYVWEKQFWGKEGGRAPVICCVDISLVPFTKSIIFFAQGESLFQSFLAFRVSACLMAKRFSSKFLFIMFTACLAFFYDIYSWQLPLAKGLDYRKINVLTAQFNFSAPLALLFWIVTLDNQRKNSHFCLRPLNLSPLRFNQRINRDILS